ncbi:TonB-dependent receptor domain-containing protein [Runella sp.]|uniref:TonB-dependent receptor domain-containing protein n=1 Tax=Runella sp. TaxID=1960881 RepID=UPI003D0CE6D2
MQYIRRTFVLLLFLVTRQLLAQEVEIKGRVVDQATQSPLIGATVSLVSTADSTKKFGAVADSLGGFALKNIPKGAYRLIASLKGYLSLAQQISADSISVDLGKIQLKFDEPVLKNEAPKNDTTLKSVTDRVIGNAGVAKDTLVQSATEKSPTAPVATGPGRVQNGTAVSNAAGTVEVKGRLVDANDKSPLIGANVILINSTDSTKRFGVVADTAGVFVFRSVPKDNYRMIASFLGYITYNQRINFRRVSPDLGIISLKTDAQLLKDVVIKGVAERVVQKGDTTVYNASAFKTNRDANAQDLIEKMPNITIENGQVKAQGENVQKVTVDGREFFGDDATLALKNLPAEVIDKIQVFDRLSDQAQFTGFDDGQTTKTINIVTRSDRNNGQFGKIYAGYGTDGRYMVGGSTNYFKKDTRISLIGMSNNVNQQNFASEDLLGVLGSSGSGAPGGGNRGGGAGGGGNRGGGGNTGGGGGNFGGGNASGNFLSGQQGGINKTHALGLNYSDNWGKKWKVSGSYFFNDANNNNQSELARTFFTTQGPGQLYNEDYFSSNNNTNHRLNARLEYTLNTKNSIIITPRISFQGNTAYSSLLGANSINAAAISQTQTQKTSTNNGNNFGNTILWRHRFGKIGRTLSVGLTTSTNDRTGESSLNSIVNYYTRKTADSLQITDQRTDTKANGYTVSSNISLTENVGRGGQLQLNYTPSYTKNYSDRKTYNYNQSTSEYSTPDLRLSNEFDNTYITNRIGGSYRLRIKKTMVTAEVNYQNAQLSGKQNYPLEFKIDRTFNNILPSAMIMYRGSDGKSLRVNYRTSTNAPSISQLQNVVDNSNPLFLKTGNPNLKQEYNHNMAIRYGFTNAKNARSFFINLNGSFTQDNISTATYIATRDTTVGGFPLNRGSQFSQPVNVNGNWNVRSFITYGLPVQSLKSNLNFNLGTGYTRTMGLINNVQNTSNTHSITGGLVLSSNISEELDFTVSVNGNYNTVTNTLQPALNGTYYYQNSNVRLNWLTKAGFFLNTNLNHTFYTGLGQDFNLNFTLWNAAVGYKFLKKQAGELKLSTFDVLGQNNSISRTVTETYIEDLQTRVLQRYYMLTFTYTLRNFR